ncbi:hypothetical protein [Streptomyces camelliae]|uniref:Uncharacterized protein n=1 Tax=Streptomyces camelliae TaxID=3004093 RepID=A0ABY7PB45_9ACTN|nr:hypothetical protein [Streptomyces sp. HUAS 2-6]WBO67821.1 hypothetical protein O1G22_35880 [Streptomyces sp. HUAS 2-6]
MATADGIRSLPPELLRKGRCGEVFFADLPDGVDRKEIIELSSGRWPKADLEPEQVDRFLLDAFANTVPLSRVNPERAPRRCGGSSSWARDHHGLAPPGVRPPVAANWRSNAGARAAMISAARL